VSLIVSYKQSTVTTSFYVTGFEKIYLIAFSK